MILQPLSLRSTLVAATVISAAFMLVLSTLLVLLTNVLHSTTSSAVASMESVRLAQEAQLELLLHSRANDALVARDHEESMKRTLSEAQTFVATADEGRVMAAAEAEVTAYIASARAPDATFARRAALVESTYGALEGLVDENVAHARQANAAAKEWARRAKYVGLAFATPLLLATAALLLWLKRRAFAPVFSLSAVMERFGKGDQDARALETGPRELREMSRRFNEMATALATQRRSRVAFLAGVAHDIRTPLSVLKMSVALVPVDEPLPAERRLRELIEKIARQITRLERMVTDFLDITQIEAGRLELKLDKHDACRIVTEVVSLFEGAFAERRLLTSLPSAAVYLCCDQVRIEQVLTNLVSNAIKYSPPDSPIEVALEQSSSVVVFRVSDRGVGIPEAERLRIFEPFRRGGPSSDSVPGVGLGLFVVQRIVEAHCGHIEIESTPGAGSTFRVHIPAARVAVSEPLGRRRMPEVVADGGEEDATIVARASLD
jgi:two-component system, OmpR family, sensor histidine kinase MtrB